MHDGLGRDRIGVLARVLLHGGMPGCGGRGGHFGGGAEVRARAVNINMPRSDLTTVLYCILLCSSCTDM